VQAGVQLVDAIDPTYVVAPNSVNGLDYVPAVANRLERALVTDVVDLTHNGDALVATREVYGGKVETTLGLLTDDAVVSLRAGEWPAADAAGDATVKAFDVDVDEAAVGSSVTGYEEVGGGDVDITEAEVLVSVGRGIDEEENLDLIFDLADALDATVSSSRPIVDAGWLKQTARSASRGRWSRPKCTSRSGSPGPSSTSPT
jgi:electron transfer flavoprotein alpha subunit